LPTLERLRKERGVEYVLAPAGPVEETTTMNVRPDAESSSILEEPGVGAQQREVLPVTLDGVCAERNLKGPYLLKMDVQGMELEVMNGAQGSSPKPKW
jgi:FkbM family methyltransferase